MLSELDKGCPSTTTFEARSSRDCTSRIASPMTGTLGMLRAMVQPAFAQLLRAIEAKRGAVLPRADIEHILRSAIAAVGAGGKSITVWLQNWTRETFDLPADYV